MKAHVEPSCQSLFGLCLSPWIYTWSYSEISAERSQAFWKRLYLCYSDSHVENPHFSHEKINVQSCELSNKRRPNLKLTSINTVRYALSRYNCKANQTWEPVEMSCFTNQLLLLILLYYYYYYYYYYYRY